MEEQQQQQQQPLNSVLLWMVLHVLLIRAIFKRDTSLLSTTEAVSQKSIDIVCNISLAFSSIVVQTLLSMKSP
jgi:hypothetical protein